MTIELLTPSEAAAILRQKPDFVRSLVRCGALRGIAIGGPKKKRILIPKQALEAYIRQSEVEPPPEQLNLHKPKLKAKPSAGFPLLEKFSKQQLEREAALEKSK